MIKPIFLIGVALAVSVSTIIWTETRGEPPIKDMQKDYRRHDFAPSERHEQHDTGIQGVDAILTVISEVGVPVAALGACFWFIYYLHRSNKGQIAEILEAKDKAVNDFMEKDSRSDDRLLAIIEKGNALTSDAFTEMKMALVDNTKTMDSLINEIRIRRT